MPAITVGERADPGRVVGELVEGEAEVFAGGRIEGNVCWSVRSSDVHSPVMFEAPSLGTAEDRAFFELGPSEETPTSTPDSGAERT